MTSRRRLLIVGCLLLVLAGGAGLVAWSDTTCTPVAGSSCVRVLFVGNSYTFVNDLPGIFRQLARAGGHPAETDMVANGGETLAEHAASADTLAAIDRSAWQYVVLQEQSEIPAIPGLRQSEMAPAAATLVADVRARKATAVLLETWAHRDGLPAEGLDYAAMQSVIDDAYTSLGAQMGVPVAPVGQTWAGVRRLDPGLALWQDDGSHPTLAGSYLAACVLYARLFDASSAGIAYTAGLPADVARTLQAAAGP